MKQIKIALCASCVAITINGCGGSGVSDQGTSKLLSATSTDITSTSVSNKENPHVIDAKTMVGWITDWKSHKPCDVKGKLIILQVGEAFASDKAHTFIRHDDKDVFTFNKAGGCSSTDPMFDRTDGVQVIPKAVLSGQMMDGALQMYGIDPLNDMLLIVAGGADSAKGMAENSAATARFAWSMRYWGIRHYAVLDGNIQYMLNPETNADLAVSLDDLFTVEASVPPMNGTHSIKEVKTMDQSVMATLEEMVNAVKNCPADSFILDARSADEYLANHDVKMSKTEMKICGPDHNGQCYTAFEGHIKGAVNIEYTDFIRTDDATSDANGDGKVDRLDASYRFKTPAEMMKLLTQNGFDPKCQTLYTYCRTGTRAALPAFVGMDILHLKTRLFDGSWIEWGRLAGRPDTADVNGNILLRSDSPWRTDIPALTEKITYNPSEMVAPRVREGSPLESDQYACHTDKIKKDDRNYLCR
ncbi:MAG: hypothetical protein B6D59_05005 [Campylobacteraceae bacterium 4484_4]|nr:MAG: hypothetical protein B6D59_05005 [Campylobacteraceae bacterium 4484_4]